MYHLLLTLSSPARSAGWRRGSLSSQGWLHLNTTPSPTPVCLNILCKQNMFRTAVLPHCRTGEIQLFIFICNFYSPAINVVWRSLIKYIDMIYSVTRTIMQLNTWSVVPAYNHMYLIIHSMALLKLVIKKKNLNLGWEGIEFSRPEMQWFQKFFELKFPCLGVLKILRNKNRMFVIYLFIKL